jgi:hypothetical protein
MGATTPQDNTFQKLQIQNEVFHTRKTKIKISQYKANGT